MFLPPKISRIETKNMEIGRRRYIREIVENALLFFKFITNKKIYITRIWYIGNIAKKPIPALNRIDDNGKTKWNVFYYQVINRYSRILYSNKHRNTVKKTSRFMGLISRNKKRIHMATDFLMPAIIKSFPLMFEISMKYYENFSSDMDFATFFTRKLGETNIDPDTCSRFFIEIIGSVEPNASWIRKMRSLSHELYGDSLLYMENFAIYIAYTIYRKCENNISTTITTMYKNSPSGICRILMENAKNIEDYLPGK